MVCNWTTICVSLHFDIKLPTRRNATYNYRIYIGMGDAMQQM